MFWSTESPLSVAILDRDSLALLERPTTAKDAGWYPRMRRFVFGKL